MTNYLVSIATQGVIFAIFVLGLNVRWGWEGDLDIAYYGFIAIGAYIDAVITLPPASQRPPTEYILGLQWPFVVGALAAMLAGAVLSLLVGALALRKLRGDYFAITTLATALIMQAVISNDARIFAGYNGLYGLSQPFNSLLRLDAHVYPVFYLVFCLAVLIAVYLFLERLFWSPFGRALRSVREDETAAAAFGRNVYALKLTGYVLGGAIAGLGGALFVHFLGAFNVSAWAPVETLLLYAAIFVGGTGNNRGVILGIFLVLIFFQEVTRFLPEIPGHPDFGPAAREIMIGILILVVLRWRPQGILPEPRARDRDRSLPVGAVAGSAVTGTGAGG